MARAKVVTNNPSRVRTLFDGLEADARKYVADNFPRPHVEPGTHVDEPSADVHLVKEDGSKEQYHAENGWTPVGGTVVDAPKQEGSTLA